MSITTMNHFTVLSDDLEATRRFYCDLFGFRVGWRPPFQFPGWWLYADGEVVATMAVSATGHCCRRRTVAQSDRRGR